jgi:CRISPR/Cas system-associated exonuclease Cas4 (RecB family)
MSDLRLSVSKTKSFLGCKASFKFNYILKFPKKEEDYHTFGKFCHKALEDFHNAYIKGSTRPYSVEMADAFKSAKIEYKDSLTKEMTTECHSILTNYLQLMVEEKNNNTQPQYIGCEEPFDFEIVPGLVLNGMIDRVQIDADGVYHNIDYKSSKSDKYLKKDFFQLLTYAYVLLHKYPAIQKVRGSYVMLRHNFKRISVEFDREEIMAVKDKFVEYARQIREETEYAPTTSMLCNFCPYLEFCVEGSKFVTKNAKYMAPSVKTGEVSF